MDRTTFLSKATNYRREPITIDDIGDVYVREVSSSEAERVTKMTKDPNVGERQATVWLAAQVLQDEAGNRILTDEDAVSLAASDEIPLRVITSITNKAAELSGWKDAETAKKNGLQS
jgi:hypothetical protein